MKQFILKTLATTGLTCAATMVLASTAFQPGQRLTAAELNTIAAQAQTVSQALGLDANGNALVAPTAADLSATINQAVSKAKANCHQATCVATVYLLANQTYQVQNNALDIPANVTIATLGQGSATINLGNSSVSLGKNIQLSHVNLVTSHAASLNQALKTNKVSLDKTTISA